MPQDHHDNEKHPRVSASAPSVDGDAEFGGTRERKRMEKKLIRRLDMRLALIVVLYLLNYVNLFLSQSMKSNSCLQQIDRTNVS